jgi:DNA-binding transcriptional ArsR family regulator
MANVQFVETARTALDVLHDPTRRHVLELLRDGEHSVRELTDATPVTQSAVSQHLRVLREAGLVKARPVGTRRMYRVDPEGLSAVRAWVDSFWDDALAAFVAHAEGHDQ